MERTEKSIQASYHYNYSSARETKCNRVNGYTLTALSLNFQDIKDSNSLVNFAMLVPSLGALSRKR